MHQYGTDLNCDCQLRSVLKPRDPIVTGEKSICEMLSESFVAGRKIIRPVNRAECFHLQNMILLAVLKFQWHGR